MENTKEYNGWKNYNTWNIALHIQGDVSLYRSARSFMRGYKGKAPYKGFIRHLGEEGDSTTDGVKLLGKKLDYKSLNKLMREL